VRARQSATGFRRVAGADGHLMVVNGLGPVPWFSAPMRTTGRGARSLGSIARSPPTPTDAGTIDDCEETALALVRRLLEDRRRWLV
jgi:hypothetical protein